MLGYYLIVLVLYTTSSPQIGAWETPSPRQYHIQTDEGPERYFRYQTDSGQYRKEKRLEDGTVVGTYAWIDADGILRQRDYIADNAGYRILKNKNVYVGRNVDVGAAVKSAKKYPPNAGTLVKTGLQHTRPVLTVPYNYIRSSTPPPSSSSYDYIPSTTSSPLSYISSTTPSPVPSSTYIPNTTPVPISTNSPYVDVSHNSVEYSTPFRIVVPTETPLVEITPNSFIKSSYNLSYISGNHLQSTPSPYRVSTEGPYYVSTPSPLTVSTQSSLYSPDDFGGSQEVDHNSLEYNPYVRQVQNNYRFQNGPTYPLDRNGRPYDSRSQNYDGVSVTNDGFRYYIPRAYHEEETQPGDKRSGSFGYIDPFGIRRVIYYNTAPGTGFQHRKNNRYVGFDATPYDPRPY